MDSVQRSLGITGLQLIDYLELEEQLPPGAVRRLPEAAPATGTHGEPVLATAIIVLSAATVQALTTWLKARHEAKQKDGITLTIDPDRTITIHVGPAARAAVRGGDTVLEGIEAVTSTLLKAAG